MQRIALWIILINIVLLVINAWLSLTNTRNLSDRVQTLELQMRKLEMRADP